MIYCDNVPSKDVHVFLNDWWWAMVHHLCVLRQPEKPRFINCPVGHAHTPIQLPVLAWPKRLHWIASRCFQPLCHWINDRSSIEVSIVCVDLLPLKKGVKKNSLLMCAWGCPWWWMNIGPGHGLVSSSAKLLPESILTQDKLQYYDASSNIFGWQLSFVCSAIMI